MSPLKKEFLLPEILVLPSLFPSAPGDHKGIFVVDYLNCVKSHVRITVLHFTLFGPEKEKIETLDGIRMIRCSFVKPSPVSRKLKYFLYPFYLLKMKKKIAELLPGKKLVHAHFAFLHGYAAVKACRKLAIPLLITEHTNPFSKLTENFLIRNLVKVAIEKADALLTVSEDLKKQVLASGIKPRKVVVTYNPVDTGLFMCGSEKQKSRRKNIVFAGRLEDYKGGLRTVKAFCRILPDFPEWNLTIIGDGPEMQGIKELLKQDAWLNDKVICTGLLSKQEIAEEFKKASFLFFPSAHETFGLVIAEAMSAGLPVVVGNKTAPPEFVDSECGLTVDPFDPEVLVKAMKQMIETVDHYDSCVIRDKTEKRFGFENFAANLMKIYSLET